MGWLLDFNASQRLKSAKHVKALAGNHFDSSEYIRSVSFFPLSLTANTA